MPIHEERQAAESFGSDAERYDRSRPDYPAALIERIVAESPGADVLDVGCGTGIAARQFRTAGCRVLGVDVDARMADRARRHGIDVEVARFEGWDPAGRTFDVVAAAQTWHWIEPVAGTARAWDVRRPGGRLAVFWNAFEPPAAVASAFAEVHRRLVPEFPALANGGSAADGYTVMAQAAADGIRATPGFGEPEIWRYDRSRTYTREAWLDVVPTHGIYARLPPERIAALVTELGAAIDAVGGSFTATYVTLAATATRTA